MHLTESYYDLVENRHTDDTSINNFSYILHFKQLVGVTDHRRHQNRNFRDKIGYALCSTFLSLHIFYVFYELLPVQYTELKFTGQPPKEY